MNIQKESWRDCVYWLVRCEVLRPDHISCQPEAKVEDFAYTIRDGVLLCHLINTLEPDCIDWQYVNLNPKATRCLCIQNINIFLTACHKEFGVKSDDLFDAQELFDLIDFYQCLVTLSILSNTPKAVSRVTCGFHTNISRNNEATARYLTIREVDTRRSLELSENAVLSEHRESMRQDAIYERLVRQPKASIPASPKSPKKEKRDFIIEEILDSEKSYLEKALKIVLTLFMEQLRSVLSPIDLQAIFGDMEILTRLHENFYEDLKNSKQPENNLQLSDIFLKYYEKFLIYGSYCSNISKAQELLKARCKERPEVKNVINKQQQDPQCGRFTLADMLLVPMQRILKYRLLLSRLLEDTPLDHPEHEGLKDAVEAMTDVNNYVNDVKRDNDALQTVQKIEERISHIEMPQNSTLKCYGRLLKDDELRIKIPNQKNLCSRYVFVFDQVVLICKSQKDNKFICMDVLPLLKYEVKVAQQTTSIKNWNYCFNLVHKENLKQYVLFARNEEHKNSWIRAIAEALDNIEPSGSRNKNHKFLMHTFEKPTICYGCNKSLKGLIMQGYSCTYCKVPAHKTCIRNIGQCVIPPLRPKLQTGLPPPPYGDITDWSDYRFLGQYAWFAGRLSREAADEMLRAQRRGTFMLRVRVLGPPSPDETEYAISLRSTTGVLHLRVYKRMNDSTQIQFFLSEARFFPSIVEIVEFYKHWSLQENFVDLNERLLIPFKEEASPPFESLNLITQEDFPEAEDYHDMDKVERKRQNSQSSSSTVHFQNKLYSPAGKHEKVFFSDEDICDEIANEADNRSTSSRSSSSISLSQDTIMNRSVEERRWRSRNDSSTQTLVEEASNNLEEDIEKFIEFLVVALRLIKRRETFSNVCKSIRKNVNEALDKDDSE